MENFNLDKLEKQNIYKTPENFFSEVQNNVLKQTILKQKEPMVKEFKIKKIKPNYTWLYAVAASLVLFVGLLLFIQTPENVVQDDEQSIAQNKTIGNKQEFSETEKTVTDVNVEAKTSQEKPAEPLANNTKMIATDNAQRETNNSKKIISSDREKAIEQVLVSFTSAELAEMSTGYEMDVYLDLFN